MLLECATFYANVRWKGKQGWDTGTLEPEHQAPSLSDTWHMLDLEPAQASIQHEKLSYLWYNNFQKGDGVNAEIYVYVANLKTQ